jgi:hypothetical protein
MIFVRLVIILWSRSGDYECILERDTVYFCVHMEHCSSWTLVLSPNYIASHPIRHQSCYVSFVNCSNFLNTQGNGKSCLQHQCWSVHLHFPTLSPLQASMCEQEEKSVSNAVGRNEDPLLTTTVVDYMMMFSYFIFVVFLSLWLPSDVCSFCPVFVDIVNIDAGMDRWCCFSAMCWDRKVCYTYLVINVKMLLDVECEIVISTTPWCKCTLQYWSLPSIKV